MQKAPQWCELSDELDQYIVSVKNLEIGSASGFHGLKQQEISEEWDNTFAYCLAPVLAQFVVWVLQNAVKDGKGRLYFLARDGYLMYQTAKILCEKLQLPIECRYLYVSRFSLRSAEYALLGQKSLDYICLNGMNVTFERMMQRAGLNAEETERVARYLNIASENKKEQLSYDRICELRTKLSRDYYYLQKIEEHAAKRYPLAIGYLKQEGLMDDVPYAIVDSGWTGSIQKSLSHLIASQMQETAKDHFNGQKRGIDGYYFGMYEYAASANADLYHTFYFSPLSGGWRKAFFCNNLFECIFSSPEGMTLEYQEKNGRFCPVFAAGENPNRDKIRRSAELLRIYAELFCAKKVSAQSDTLSKDVRNADKFLVDMQIITKLLSLFMGHPSKAEAETFGSYLFCDDTDGKEILPVAAELDTKQWKQNSLIQRLLQYLTRRERPALCSAWMEGSVMLSNKSSSFYLFQSALYKYLLFTRKSLEQRRRK